MKSIKVNKVEFSEIMRALDIYLDGLNALFTYQAKRRNPKTIEIEKRIKIVAKILRKLEKEGVSV